jgi:hypothetical protein
MERDQMKFAVFSKYVPVRTSIYWYVMVHIACNNASTELNVELVFHSGRMDWREP